MGHEVRSVYPVGSYCLVTYNGQCSVGHILRQQCPQSLIAAGLIKSTNDVEAALRAGAIAVDTSNERLWNLNFPVKANCEANT